MYRKPLAALSLCAVLFCCAAPALAQDCTPPAIVANAKSDNMFTPEQEMIFGELAVQNMAGEVRFIRDEKLTAYITQIGDRIIKHLPQTGLKFHFYVVDLPEANAFNLPGGHIAVSRKLIGFVNNEDELAGVIAHELGHATVRHGAQDMSEALRKVLNVTSLGDRKDVTEKYNLLIERARTRRYSRSRGHENGQQLEADQIGVYALVAAGYDPNGLASFFERLTESKAKGGWFSDLFGSASPEQKRLYEMAKAAEKMPAPCRERAAARPTDEFLKWQAEVVSYHEAGRKEELPGLLWRKELQPKLRSDISHLAFSRDGKLLLAQDDYSVNVIAREPQPHVLFQIPVEDADEASFTPDGRFVIFTTENLRYERWSVADAAPVEVREIVTRADCWEHGLSPDGSYLACVDTSAGASLLDVKTGKKVWEKKDFYQLDLFEYLTWIASTARRGAGDDDNSDDVGFFRIGFSPDAHYALFSRSMRFRYRLSVDGLNVAGSENTAAAVDLTTLKQVDLGGDLKKLAARPYAFIDPGTVLGNPTPKIADAGLFAFPSGKRLKKFEFGANVVQRTESPDLVVVKPLANTKLGIYDVKRGTIIGGLDKDDATFFGNLVAYESINGNVLLREASYDDAAKRLELKDVGTVEVPVSPVHGLAASDVSDDFAWLMLSSKTRGGLWSLKTGERKLYVRGFKGAVTANDGGAVGGFPKMGEAPHSLVLMNGANGNAAPIRELPEKGARQFGRFVLTRASLKAQPNTATAAAAALHGEDEDEYALRREVRFELKDLIRDKVIWTRDFQKEAPEYSFDSYSGRLIFYWRLGSDAGKAKLKESAELKAKADALGNKADDYLVEVVDAFSQQAVGSMLLETGKGSFDVGRGLSEGDRLVLHDSEGRVLVYSLKTGELRHRFFGNTAAINPKRNQLVVENFPGEVSVYDLDTGDLKASLRINGSAAFVRFNLSGDRLFVLSDAQTAYAFDLDKLAAGSAPAAQAAN